MRCTHGTYASYTPWRRYDHFGVDRARLHARPSAPEELLAEPETQQTVPGEKGRQNAGHRHGRVHRLLATVLRRQPVVRFLRRELRVQGPTVVVRGRLARLDQQRHEPRDLRVLEQRLPQVRRVFVQLVLFRVFQGRRVERDEGAIYANVSEFVRLSRLLFVLALKKHRPVNGRARRGAIVTFR